MLCDLDPIASQSTGDVCDEQVKEQVVVSCAAPPTAATDSGPFATGHTSKKYNRQCLTFYRNIWH